MGQRFDWWIGVGVIVALASVGFLAYNAGVAHGLAQAGAAAGSAVPISTWHARPWGYGFGFFPFVFLLFWFVCLRGLFWRRRWYGRGYPYYGYGCGYPEDVPPAFDEWHRRAHARPNAPPPDAKA